VDAGPTPNRSIAGYSSGPSRRNQSSSIHCPLRSAIKRGLHALRIARDHQIGKPRQQAGYCNYFVKAPSALGRNLAGVDCTL
jgi:hypothetical protein